MVTLGPYNLTLMTEKHDEHATVKLISRYNGFISPPIPHDVYAYRLFVRITTSPFHQLTLNLWIN